VVKVSEKNQCWKIFARTSLSQVNRYEMQVKALMGLLQQTITWYKIRHTGGQAHYYSRTGTLKQRQVLPDLSGPLRFNVPVRE